MYRVKVTNLENYGFAMGLTTEAELERILF
jgi:hypothetical protein